MPIYVYRCTNCGEKTEVQQKYTDAALTKCKKCKTKSLKRIVQNSAAIFKGSGWYKTDNRIT